MPIFAQPLDQVAADRCPYSALVSTGECSCPAFDPITVDNFDSMNRPLEPLRTCRHLVAGQVRDQEGRFYPRCALGSAEQRDRWVEQDAPAVRRAFGELEARLNADVAEERHAVFEAKRDVAKVTSLREAGDALVAKASTFFEAHAGEFVALGRPPRSLDAAFRAWTADWIKSRDFDPPRISWDAPEPQASSKDS